MDIVTQPSGWLEMTTELFEAYLQVCPDYRRDNYANASRYFYAHNHEHFAVVTVRNKVFVHPTVAALKEGSTASF